MPVISLAPYNEMGTLIKRVRKAKGITLAALAAEIHTTPATIYNLENNHRFTREVIDNVCNALGIAPMVGFIASNEDYGRLIEYEQYHKSVANPADLLTVGRGRRKAK